MKDTEKVQELKDQGNKLLAEGKTQQAIDAYTKALELDPANHVLYSNRSAAYAKIGNFEQSLNDAQKTIGIDPNWPKGYSRKAAALTYLKRYDDAESCYRLGLLKDANNAQLLQGLEEVQRLRLENETDHKFPNVFAGPHVFEKLRNDSRTKQYMLQPDFVAMISELQTNPKSISTKLQDPRLLTALGVLMGIDMNVMDPDDTMEEDTFENNNNINGNHFNYSNENKSKINSETKKEPESMSVDLALNQIEALKEKDLGNEAYKKKNFDQAIIHYDKAIELDPTNMTFLTNKSAVFFEQGSYQDCIHSCIKAIEVGKENFADFKLIAKAYARLGNAYFKLKDWANAITYYQKSLTEHRSPDIVKKLHETEKIKKEEEVKAYVDPQLALEEKAKGNELFQKGDYPTALKHYSEAIKRNPQDAILYSNRAACYTKLAEFRLGLQDCDKCLELDPNFVKGYTRKGHILLGLKEGAKALAAYQKALELDPSSQEALEGTRRCYDTVGQNQSSRSTEEIKEKALQNPEVQSILGDPAMRMILEQMQNDPNALREHMKNPNIAGKIQKLIEVGIIQIR